MAIVKTPVAWVMEEYACDTCKVGKMTPTGMVLFSQPPLYPHRCDKCDKHLNLSQRYPNLAYRVVQPSEN